MVSTHVDENHGAVRQHVLKDVWLKAHQPGISRPGPTTEDAYFLTSPHGWYPPMWMKIGYKSVQTTDLEIDLTWVPEPVNQSDPDTVLRTHFCCH
jgi:hypothetical protein